MNIHRIGRQIEYIWGLAAVIMLMGGNHVAARGDELTTTKPHRFWVINRDADGDGIRGEWIEAEDLQPGDHFRLADGGEAVLKDKSVINRFSAHGGQSNLPSTNRIHSVQAASKKKPVNTSEHEPWNGVHAEGLNTPTPHGAYTTYNFAVAEWYTYFVGADGVWVHNQNTSGFPCSLPAWKMTFDGTRVDVTSQIHRHLDWQSPPPFHKYIMAWVVVKNSKLESFIKAITETEAYIINTARNNRLAGAELDLDLSFVPPTHVDRVLPKLLKEHNYIKVTSRIADDKGSLLIPPHINQVYDNAGRLLLKKTLIDRADLIKNPRAYGFSARDVAEHGLRGYLLNLLSHPPLSRFQLQHAIDSGLSWEELSDLLNKISQEGY